jgi:hypothetical protein
MIEKKEEKFGWRWCETRDCGKWWEMMFNGGEPETKSKKMTK